MRSEKKDIDSLRSEGDLNISPRRRAWAKEHIDAETQRWVNIEGRVYADDYSGFESTSGLPLFPSFGIAYVSAAL